MAKESNEPVSEATKKKRAHAAEIRAKLKLQREAAARGEYPEGYEEEPDLYEAMCHVLALPKSYDTKPMQEVAREWLKESRGTFMAKYADFQKAREPVKVEGEVKEDVGTAAALAHADRFLEGLRNGEAS